MKLKSLIASAAAIAALAASAGAFAQSTDSIKANIEQFTGGKVKVDRIEKTPVPGLYEVISDGEVLYTDSTGRFGIVGGAMVDMKTQADLTAQSLDQLTSVAWDKLPLQGAIKEVHGNGGRKMALFEDPNCPVCKVFTKFADQLDDVTIYHVPYPVISPESQTLARIAWCAKDRGAAWKALMHGERFDGSKDCDVTGLATILKFGEQYKVDATPTVFLGNGRRLVGATPPDQFIAALNASVKN